MGLYSFSKTSWHVRFYGWLFDEDATGRFKTMCPYFWTYVCIMIFLPIIVLFKMCGKYGNEILTYCNDYKRNRENMSIEKLKNDMMSINLTPNGAYKIYMSKCYEDYKYSSWDSQYTQVLRSDGRTMSFNDLKDEYTDDRKKLRWAKQAKLELKVQAKEDAKQNRVESMNKFKSDFVVNYEKLMENKILNFITISIMYLTLAFVVGVLLYVFYNVLTLVNWTYIGYILLGTLGIGLLGGGIFLLVKYILKPLGKWLSCVKFSKCSRCENFWNSIGEFFKGVYDIIKKILWFIWSPIKYLGIGIGKLFGIMGHMVYSTYKKQCPIIEWKDED